MPQKTVALPESKPKHGARIVLFAVGFVSAIFLLVLLSFNYSSNSSVNPNEVKSIAEIKTAIDLEPASVLNHSIYGEILFFARRYDEAITELERTAEMDPDFYFAYAWLSYSYRLKGNDDKSFESFVQAQILGGEEPDEINLWKTIYAKSVSGLANLFKGFGDKIVPRDDKLCVWRVKTQSRRNALRHGKHKKPQDCREFGLSGRRSYASGNLDSRPFC